MRALHIIMPMAGEGSRFLSRGIITPPPMIRFQGLPLFARALDSFHGLSVPRQVSMVVRQEHISRHAIDQEVRAFVPKANIFTVPSTTRGAAETCLQARSAIADDDGILVLDCDVEFRSRSFEAAIIKKLCEPSCQANGGALLSFPSNKPCYSYAVADEQGYVLRTVEKQVVSPHALAGAYFFSTGALFLQAAHRYLADVTLEESEAYVSLIYNYLIKEGHRVVLTTVEDYHSYGTPEELNDEQERWTLR